MGNACPPNEIPAKSPASDSPLDFMRQRRRFADGLGGFRGSNGSDSVVMQNRLNVNQKAHRIFSMADSSAISKRFQKAKNRLMVQASDLSLGTIAEMVDKNAIDISPKYQRRERWDRNRQSALIESFLLNIPVPPVYLAEDEKGNYSVVDGKQRITSIWLFLQNQLVLNGLQDFTEIEGLKFDDLPFEMQNTLRIRPFVRVITLLNQSDPELKYEVFIRLNRGGESMNPQELRNVAYQGEFNDVVFDLARSEFLRSQLKITDDKSSAFQNMQDAEIVLRFFALRENWRKFSGDYRSEMDKYMADSLLFSKEQIFNARQRYERALNGCKSIWGGKAFRRPDGENWRDQFLNGLYDAQMIAVDMLNDKELQKAINNSDIVIDKTIDLFADSKFDVSVRQGTNNPEKIRTRIEGVLSILR